MMCNLVDHYGWFMMKKSIIYVGLMCCSSLRNFCIIQYLNQLTVYSENHLFYWIYKLLFNMSIILCNIFVKIIKNLSKSDLNDY